MIRRKTILYALLLMVGWTTLRAQEPAEGADDSLQVSMPVRIGAPGTYASAMGSPVIGTPWMGYGLGAWNLHQGLNGQIGAGVQVGFGKNNPWKGASFFTNLAGMYVAPLSKNGRWTGAVGGYFNNYRMFGSQVNTMGVVGMVDYRVNDRMDVGGFVMHDFGVLGSDKSPMMMTCPLTSSSTTVGANMNWRVSDNASIGLQVSVTKYHTDGQFMPEQRPVTNRENTIQSPVRGSR